MNSLELSEDAKTILLLCGNFGDRKSDTDVPMSFSEYNRVAFWLSNHKYSLADLASGSTLNALREEHPANIDPTRCERLLSRGAAMAFALERWMNKGVWVVCRSDNDYPRRLREHLKMQAPPILYGIGERNLMDTIGLAVVGSRNVDQDGTDFASEVSRRAAQNGMSIVSGGAKGVDRISMAAALEEGGTVIGVMADSLLKTSLRQDVRDYIRNRQLTLVSPYHPEAGWSVGNAMGRNKHIYALSEYAVVVSAEYKRGGTWDGAVEELRRDNHVPVFVRLNGNIPGGNRELTKKGAIPFPEQPGGNPLLELLGEAARGTFVGVTGVDGDLLTGVKHEASPPSPEPIDAIEEPSATYSTDSSTRTSVGTVFEAVLPVLIDSLRQPHTAADLSQNLDVQKAQLDKWIKEAAKRGLIKKLTKPTRYVAVQQDTLFK